MEGHVHICSGCEAIVYVEEQTALGSAPCRISATKLQAYLTQSTVRAQLQQMCVSDVCARVAMDSGRRAVYLKSAPAGVDVGVWRAAIANNPQPRQLLPFVVRGVTALHERALAQAHEHKQHEAYVERLKQRTASAGIRATQLQSRIDTVCADQDRLAHRLVNVVCAQWMRARRGTAFDGAEQELAKRVDDVYALLMAPEQVRPRLNALLGAVRAQPYILAKKAQVKAKMGEKPVDDDAFEADEKLKEEVRSGMILPFAAGAVVHGDHSTQHQHDGEDGRVRSSTRATSVRARDRVHVDAGRVAGRRQFTNAAAADVPLP